MEITLEQLLNSRDRRHDKQMELLQRYPDSTLVCATVVMPGKIKRNKDTQVIARVLVDQLSSFEPLYIKQQDVETGFEVYMVTSLPAIETKRTSCHIEDTHPLGRLMDIDVIASDGIPISREIVGASPRRCLLCAHEARWCMRNHTHTTEQLLTHIHQMVETYLQQNYTHSR